MTEPMLNSRLLTAIERATLVAESFAKAGYHFYFVGGVVRDSLIGIDREENDLDVTTEALPDRIKELVSPLASAVWSQGERFGTIGCVIDGHMYEITTHRAERYEPGSRKPVVAFGDRLDEDLSRRDFTVNAMAVDVLDRRIVDLFGGATDLRDHVLRTPLDPLISFSDDPLRMLRAARFLSGYGLMPVPELVTAIESMIDRLSIVSFERIREELQKLLLLPDSSAGLELLRSTGLMASIIPELAGTTSEELASVSARVSAVAEIAAHRWAALLPDRGVLRKRLHGLKASGALMTDAELLLRGANQIDLADPHDDSDVRRLAALCGPGDRRAEDVTGWKRRFVAATGGSTVALDDLDSSLARLRAAEPDLDSPDVGLNGNDICRELEIESGVDVGRAVAWLRDLRFSEGVIPQSELRARLRSWWQAS